MRSRKAHFSRQLLKAIDSWQAGSVGKRKKAKHIASILKGEPVETYYRSCDESCFRRSIISKSTIKQLFFEFALPEETSSWTMRSDVAARFKGGPPEPPLAGVMFCHKPESDEVVLNLERLMTHEQFWPSVEQAEVEGADFSKGLRKWASTQHEVILTVDSVPHQEFYALGSNAAQSILDGDMTNVAIIGDTSLTADEVSQAFADAGPSTRKWLFGDAGLWAYERWIQKTLARLHQ